MSSENIKPTQQDKKEVDIVEIFKARALMLRANKIMKDLTEDCPALCFCVLCTVKHDNEANFDKLNIHWR